MSEAIVIRLGDEELAYLAHALKVRAIPGVRSALLDALDPDHFALAMAVADRSLRARGLVQWLSQDEREYEPLAAAVVRAMAAPRFSAVVDVREGTKAAAFDFVFAGQSVVEHTTPEPGVHQFVIMDAAADLAQRLGNLLRVEQAPAGTGHASLPRALFANLAGQAAQSRQVAEQALAPYLGPADASACIITLAAPLTRLSATLKDGDLSSGVELGTLTAIAGAGGCWVAAPVAQQAGVVDLHGATREQVRDDLLGLLRPALATLALA